MFNAQSTAKVISGQEKMGVNDIVPGSEWWAGEDEKSRDKR